MISYSIDPTVFNPPALPEQPPENEERNQIKRNIRKYRETINKCYDLLIHQNSISVYLLRGTNNNFSHDYTRKATEYFGNDPDFLPLDTTRIMLQEDILGGRYISRCGFGDRAEGNKVYFNDWFNIRNLNIGNCTLPPSLNELIAQDNGLESRLIMIGILNQFVYKRNDYHFLILNNNDASVSIEANIDFTFLREDHNNEPLDTQVQTKQIDNIIIEQERFNNVHAAYEAASNEFADYLIFGANVIIGIGTIRNTAGPPDRIFAYLETLKDFCIYKRNNPNTSYDDAGILCVLGCICSHETIADLQNQQVIDARMFDNGAGQRILCELHLKPNTFTPAPGRSRTVRIHFKWDGNRNKVLIGWIGDHCYSPERN